VERPGQLFNTTGGMEPFAQKERRELRSNMNPRRKKEGNWLVADLQKNPRERPASTTMARIKPYLRALNKTITDD